MEQSGSKGKMSVYEKEVRKGRENLIKSQAWMQESRI
jgi:hypothetical protein